MAQTSPHQTLPAFAELDKTTPVDLLRMVRLVWAGKWIIMLATGLSVLVAGYYGFAVAGPRYAALTIIDTMAAEPAQATSDPATQIQVMLANATLQQVIDRLALHDDPAFNRYLTPLSPLSVTTLRTNLRNMLQGRTEPPPDAQAISSKLVQNLRAAIRADNPRDSSLLRVTVTTGDPDRAIAIANTLAAVYLADQLTRKTDSHAATFASLTTQSDDLHIRQSATETAMTALIAQSGLQDPARHDTLGRQLTDTQTQLATAQAALARATDRANRLRLTHQIAAMETSRDDLAAQLDLLSDARNTHDRMQAELEAARTRQAAYQGQLQDLTLRADQLGPDGRVLNAATQAQYIGPQKILLIQIAAVVGALAGLMLVMLQHSLRRGFTDAQPLQDATGLPVIAQLPLLPSRNPARLLAVLDAPGATAATESYRHLRTALLMQGTAAPQVILSTSAIPGEGKTTQAIGLAHSLAMLGKRVLLIDADLRQGSFARYFHLAGTDGLAAVILGHIGLQAAVEPSPIPGVDLLAGGAQDGNGAELLFLPALADVMAQARALYDIVVIDAPPVVPVPDALALAFHADATIFAVRWDKTPAPVVLAATDKLAAANLRITGLTLTQIHCRRQAQRGGISFARYGRGYFHA